MGLRDDEFKRFLESQFSQWSEEREARQARTVTELWDDWISEVPPKVPHRRGHRWWLNLRFRVDDREISLGQLTTEEVTPRIVSAFLGAVAVTPGRRVKRPLKPGTIEQIRLSLSACFAWHVIHTGLERNPMKAPAGEVAKVPGSDLAREGYLTKDEAYRIAAAMPPVAGYLCRHLFTTGCRIDNLRTLKRHQIDFQAGDLALRVKGGKQRRILIPTEALDELRLLVAVAPGEFVYQHPKRSKPAPIPYKTLHTWLRKGCKDIGFTHVAGEQVTFHHFRHGRAVNLLERGTDIYLVKEQLAHSRIETTERYIRMRGKMRQILRKKLDE